MFPNQTGLKILMKLYNKVVIEFDLYWNRTTEKTGVGIVDSSGKYLLQ